MNLKQLQHFVVLAETGNVRRASVRLNLTQPALSKSIRALEEELDVVLFERLARGVRLTRTGEWLRSRSAALLADFRQVRTELELIRRHSDSTVRIAAGTVLCAALMPRCLGRLHEVAPHIRVTVEAGYWDQQQHMLLSGEIDFFVADSRELEDIIDFEITALPPEAICAYVRAGHPLAKRKKLRLADLHNHAYAGLNKMPRQLERIVREYPELPPNHPEHAAFVSNDFSLLRSAALHSDVVFFSPPSAVHEQVRRGELLRLPLPLPARLQTHFAIIRLKNRPLSVAAELLKHAILECAAGCGAP